MAEDVGQPDAEEDDGMWWKKTVRSWLDT